MKTQDWKDKQLDKDILFPGNKIYSPATCLFVCTKINGFLINCVKPKGGLPMGVVFCRGKFLAQCNNPFNNNNKRIGSFNTPEEAHLAWKAKKHEHACKLAELETDLRIKKALVNRFKP